MSKKGADDRVSTFEEIQCAGSASSTKEHVYRSNAILHHLMVTSL